jgi:CBS domain-containing protein
MYGRAKALPFILAGQVYLFANMAMLLPKGGVVMKLRDVMTNPVIRIHPEENVAVAARMLSRYNIGILPVCGSDGRMVGLVTDRDLVTRCLASSRSPAATAVKEVMTKQIISARPDMDAALAEYARRNRRFGGV